MKKTQLTWAFAVFVIAIAICFFVTAVFAAGGPNNGTGTASVTNTVASSSSYNFGYSFDSTYYGALSTERTEVSTDGANASVSFSSNTFTITAVSSAGVNKAGSWWDKSAQNVSTDVTITNNSGKTLKIGYTYTASNGSASGSNLNTGSDTLTWLPGQSIYFTIKTQVASWTAASSTATATFVITSCEEETSYDLKIVPSQFGTYSYSVGTDVTGTLKSSSAAYESTASDSDTVTLSVPEIDAAYADEYYFYGWSVNGSVTASSEAYSSTVTTHATIFPVFIKNGTVDSSGNGPFYVNGKYYVFWREAFLAAGASYPVVLARDYTLPTTLQENGVAEPDGLYIAGDSTSAEYIVPASGIFLIPYNDDNTMYTDASAYYGETMVTPTAFRTLTMPSGTKIVVNGSMNVAGRYAYTNSGGQSGSPTGPLGFVKMEEGSNITINGSLYAYGYIIGVKDSATGTYKCGTVTVNSGAAVYEVMQMPEFRGGDQSTGMDNNVFPLSQFYIQNIEVPMTVYKDAAVNSFSNVYVYGGGLVNKYFPTGITLFGPGGMFELTKNSQYATKWYDGSKDRLYIEIYGDVTINPISIVLDGGILGESSINSKDYVLPINGGFTITLKTGSSLTVPSTQKMLLQPGAELIIEEGATCTVNSALYIYDAAQWGAYSNWGHAGAGDSNCWDTPVIPVSYSPTRTYVRLNVFPRGLFTDADGNPVYMTNDPAIYEAIFSKNSGDLIAAEDLAEFLTLLPDASIQVDGTLTGAIYTTADGANIFSTGTGVFTQTATENASVWQLMMGCDYSFNSDNAEYYVEATATPAQLKNGNGSYQTTSADTYTYCPDCMAWLCEDNHSHAVNFATNVELGNSLNMYFAFWSDSTTIADSYYIVVSHTDWETKKTNTITFSSELWQSTTVNGKTANVVRYPGLAAKQMNDVITVTLYNGSGEVVDTWRNSIHHYAMRMLTKAESAGNAELQTLIVDMLNYGAACQTHFVYDTDNLANADLNATQKGYATPDSIEIKDNSGGTKTYYNGSQLVTSGNIQFAVAFTGLPDGAEINYSYKNHWNDGDDATKNATTSGTITYSGNVAYYINKLVVADAREMITFTYGTTTWTDSIESYCARMIAAGNDTSGVYTAFMKFSDSAETYLEEGKTT